MNISIEGGYMLALEPENSAEQCQINALVKILERDRIECICPFGSRMNGVGVIVTRKPQEPKAK